MEMKGAQLTRHLELAGSGPPIRHWPCMALFRARPELTARGLDDRGAVGAGARLLPHVRKRHGPIPPEARAGQFST